MQLHPQEALLQQARALQGSPPFRDYRRRRQVAEHAIARLVQRGIRQARYRGIPKTLFQALMAAAVVNLTLIAGLGGALWLLWVGVVMAVVAPWGPSGHPVRRFASPAIRPAYSQPPGVSAVDFLKNAAYRLSL